MDDNVFAAVFGRGAPVAFRVVADDNIGERCAARVRYAAARHSVPHIVIGDDTESDWSTATEDGSEHAVVIHVWSRADGSKEAKLVADAVRDTPDGANFAVTARP